VPLFGISSFSLLIIAALVVHVVKTGRNQAWILAIVFLPGVGWVAYLAMEVLPEMLGGRTARRARAGVQRMIDPNRDMRRAATEVEITGNVDARRRLAEEQFDRGQFDQAIETYQTGLKGIFEHDPTLLQGLAQAQFAKQDPAAARATLELLMQHNPEFKSPEAKLMYARALEDTGALEEAERAFAAIAGPYPGAEARLRYALLLKRRGKSSEAQTLFKDLLDGARLGPAHYRKSQARWLDIAKRELG
jgi:hypothetical protein